MLRFRKDGEGEFQIAIDRLVIAGWAARDRAAAEAHIRELEEIGVPPPTSIPCFYRVAAANLTTGNNIQVLGGETSGEVEIVLMSAPDGLWVTVGSDHTDRQVETYSVAVSKQACAKPLAGDAWRFDDVIDHWDRLELRAWATFDAGRQLYQEGTAAALLPPAELIAKYTGGGALPVGTAMYCGTMTAIGGVRPAERFEMELTDPVLGRRILHAYEVEALPVVT